MFAGLTEKLWARFLLCFCLGAVGALSMPPFPVWMLPALMLSLSGFWLVLTSFDKRWHAPLAGFLFGFGYFLAGIWWVGNALLVGGNPYLWALPLAVSGLQALLAFFPMMAALSSQWLYKGRTLGAYLFFLCMMGFWEWGRGTFFTGFPWNLFGMSWTYSLPMLQILSVGGIYLLSLITIFICSVPGFALKGDAPKAVRVLVLSLSALLTTGLYVYGQARLEANPTTYNRDVIIQIVTPNIPQERKWDNAFFWANYRQTLDEMKPSVVSSNIQGQTRVIVLPETALHYAHRAVPEAMADLQSILSAYPEKTYLLTGMLRHSTDVSSGAESYHNSLVGLDSNLNEVVTFDKFHLVPFGEYIPFQQYIPIGPVVAFAGFESGDGPETFTLDGLPAFSPLVCYEVIFPGAVTAAPPPKWIVNVTNDAWYGISPGPFQHLGHAVYRAIEEGVPVIRSTNTGFSAIIDPAGRIIEQSGLFETSSQISHLPQSPELPTYFSTGKQKLFFIALLCLFFPFLGAKLTRKHR